MLALTLASPSRASCLVFDEVDAGVGGATARTLAQCLSELATDHQVIVVTHLAHGCRRRTAPDRGDAQRRARRASLGPPARTGRIACQRSRGCSRRPT